MYYSTPCRSFPVHFQGVDDAHNGHVSGDIVVTEYASGGAARDHQHLLAHSGPHHIGRATWVFFGLVSSWTTISFSPSKRGSFFVAQTWPMTRHIITAVCLLSSAFPDQLGAGPGKQVPGQGRDDRAGGDGDGGALFQQFSCLGLGNQPAGVGHAAALRGHNGRGLELGGLGLGQDLLGGLAGHLHPKTSRVRA